MTLNRQLQHLLLIATTSCLLATPACRREQPPRESSPAAQQLAAQPIPEQPTDVTSEKPPLAVSAAKKTATHPERLSHNDESDFSRPANTRFEGADGKPVARAPTDSYAALSDEVVARTGRVEHKEWTKSEESWMASGSDYFVLVCDPAPAGSRKDEERLILRPTRDHPFSSFYDLLDHRVEIQGRQAANVVFKPDPRTQFTNQRADGTCISGGGLLVDSTKEIEPDQKRP